MDNWDDIPRRLHPPPRVKTTTRGQNVWLGDVEILDLELELDSDSEDTDYDPYNSAR